MTLNFWPFKNKKSTTKAFSYPTKSLPYAPIKNNSIYTNEYFDDDYLNPNIVKYKKEVD